MLLEQGDYNGLVQACTCVRDGERRRDGETQRDGERRAERNGLRRIEIRRDGKMGRDGDGLRPVDTG